MLVCVKEWRFGHEFEVSSALFLKAAGLMRNGLAIQALRLSFESHGGGAIDDSAHRHGPRLLGLAPQCRAAAAVPLPAACGAAKAAASQRHGS